MPKVKCQCGYIFNLSVDSPLEYNLIPEKDIMDFIIEAEEKEISGERIDDCLSKNRQRVLICPQCQKLLVDHRSDGHYTAYEQMSPQEPTGENVYRDLG